MPILGLAHVLIALFFAVHAVRSGRELYWLILLFMFPLLGSLVYFLAIYLPQSRLDRTLGKATAKVRDALDPGRAVRDAQAAFDLTPTAHNQVRLAQCMVDAGMFAEAVTQYDACLAGPFAGDPDILFGAACARLADGQGAQAVRTLLDLRQRHPSFREEQVSLMLARAYAAEGMHLEANTQFASVVERFAGIEARAAYALWAIGQGERVIAHAQLKELNQSRKHMKQATLDLHGDLFKRLDAAARTMTE